ncbi:MAG: PEP/pyruvate-binding domain-containing protein [Myxococcota bacterium]
MLRLVRTGLPTLLLLSACSGPSDKDGEPVDTGDTADTGDTGAADVACDEAEARLGYRACVHAVPDEETFTDVTLPAGSVDQLRVGKYLVPVADAPVPTAFLDVNAFTLHYDFLVTAFPDAYAGLTTGQYNDMVLYPDTRVYYAGSYALYIDGDGFFYGFTVWDDPADETSTVTMADVTAVWTSLSERFGIGELAFVPNSPAQQEAALGWTEAPFPIENPAELDYEPYNPGAAYGYLRLYTLDELADATDDGAFGYQDIVVIDQAPEDLERVVSGIVTGTRQGTLSHLNVRSTARGTPNCYVNDPLDELAAWEDQLVRFECGETGYAVESATIEDAEAWWTSIRPAPVDICAPNLDETGMPGLLELATSTREERDAGVCTYGAKGANLATLYQRIDPAFQLDGFLIPFGYYDRFVSETTWWVDLGDGSGLAEHSFAETIAYLHTDPAFLTDASVRAEWLELLTDAMEDDAVVDPEVLDLVAARILEVWGTDDVMVRFRSSSNAEDGLSFSGAGLYQSESGCLADELDGDLIGPSHCDPLKEDEQTISHALLEVWASTWGMVAWEERDWYGIDHTDVAMGVLVDTRTGGELANIVAFTGNPTSVGDDRYLVNAQYGELEVVAAEPGVWPEKSLLTLDEGGAVVTIDRVSESSEAEIVLTDAQLDALGGQLWEIARVFPLDEEVPAGHTLLWDTEWKVRSDGQLVIKQIRPFLR